MTSTEWHRVEGLLDSALKLEPEQRRRFLERACGRDAGLRGEVESLLSYELQAEQFLESPALDVLTGSSFTNAAGPPTFAPGLAIGSYRIAEVLGRGGMGEVYRATDTRLGRDVAIKFLPAHLCADLSVLERFRRETRAVSALNDPNICRLYDVGEYEGQPYFVMELLEGRSLKDLLTDGALAPSEVARLGVQICRGLETAHAKGIVHRDIKPANIFVTSRGQVKVLDFGVAKLRLESLPLSEHNTQCAVDWGGPLG